MSQRWGLVCLSHTPPLISERWFNHGADALRDAVVRERAGEWPVDPDLDALGWPAPVVHNDVATTDPIFWLREHPQCAVALRDERGDVEPIETPFYRVSGMDAVVRHVATSSQATSALCGQRVFAYPHLSLRQRRLPVCSRCRKKITEGAPGA